MAEEPRNEQDRDADAARLRDLEARIAALTPKPSGPGPMGKYEQANLAWRMVIEFVTGLCLGGAVGYGLDYLLGTGPLLMVVFIFLGLAAGIKTMMRTAGELERTAGRSPDEAQPGQAPGRDERD